MGVEERTTRRLAISKIDVHRCIGCTTCVHSCFNDVIRMKKGKAYIAYQEDCSQCFACVEDCPRDAISLSLI